MTTRAERNEAIMLIDEAVSKGARKSKAANILNISVRTIQRWKKQGLKDNRKGAKKLVKNALTKKEKDEIVKISCSERFMNTTPYNIVPILAEEGKYVASESSFYRVLREKKLLKHRKNTRKRRRVDQIEVKATSSNQIWSWDITYLKTNVKGKFYYLYLFMDIWSRFIVGWEVHESENGEKSSKMMKKLCNTHNIEEEMLLLHSDNGGPMKSATMLATLDFLGVKPSYSRPSVSNDNAYSESLFKTLKYTAGYPKCFNTLEEAKDWVFNFVKWYNNEHRHSKIGYVTPKQRYKGLDKEIIKKRREVYKKARKENPERWSKKTRNWDVVEEVYLKKGNFGKAS